MDYKEIADICRSYNIYNWCLNDGKVDVRGNVDLYDKRLTELPLQFGRIYGSFTCSINNLTSLKGAPYHVDGYFYCNSNRLKTLEYGPQYVGDTYTCIDNTLLSLKGCPNHVGVNFNCYYNKIETLGWLPNYIGGYLDIDSNNISEIVDIPFKFKIEDNPAYDIYKHICEINGDILIPLVNINYFKDSKILIGRDIYIDRFKAFLDLYGLDNNINIDELIDAGYTIK